LGSCTKTSPNFHFSGLPNFKGEGPQISQITLTSNVRKFGNNQQSDLQDYALKKRKKHQQQNKKASPHYCKGGHNKKMNQT